MKLHLFLAAVLFPGSFSWGHDYFSIRVVDGLTGRGVPLVELATVNNIRCYTDSAGYVAFNEPGLMNRDVFFHIRSHGYAFPADGFGFRGKILKTVPGDEVTLPIQRVNIAERLYRITGQGIYGDSVLLGKPVPISEPLLNAAVLGSDSVQLATFQNKLYWFWGDTNLPRYPLGLFHMPGATSELPASGGLKPEQGVNLKYFRDERGNAVNTAQMPGDGPTWLSGVTVLKDSDGRERMFAGYAKIKPPLAAYERGIVEFNPETNRFQQVASFAADVPLSPEGHPLQVTENGVDYVYFARPFPIVRVRATPADYLDLSRYEAYTCLAPGSTEAAPRLDRDESGKLNYAWKSNVPPLLWETQQKLIQAGTLRRDELQFQLHDVETGKPVLAHGGSVYWNAYRQRFIMIVLEVFGTSPLGEIWYAEAETPLGPWGPARKVVTHENYSFYNPKHHPQFDEDGGRIIYFEGTYTHTFTNNPDQTPRYDYNQIMYRLDLGDERLREK